MSADAWILSIQALKASVWEQISKYQDKVLKFLGALDMIKFQI